MTHLAHTEGPSLALPIHSVTRVEHAGPDIFQSHFQPRVCTACSTLSAELIFLGRRLHVGVSAAASSFAAWSPPAQSGKPDSLPVEHPSPMAGTRQLDPSPESCRKLRRAETNVGEPPSPFLCVIDVASVTPNAAGASGEQQQTWGLSPQHSPQALPWFAFPRGASFPSVGQRQQSAGSPVGRAAGRSAWLALQKGKH